MNQQGVVGCVNCSHPTDTGVQEAKLRVRSNLKTGFAEERPTYACAIVRAGHTAKQFIVELRALVEAVTQVADMQADEGRPTAIVTRAGRGAAVSFVLAARAVEHTVASDVDGQAVAVIRALEVGLRAQGRAVVRGVDEGGGEAASAVQLDESGRWQGQHGAGASSGVWTL